MYIYSSILYVAVSCISAPRLAHIHIKDPPLQYKVSERWVESRSIVISSTPSRNLHSPFKSHVLVVQVSQVICWLAVSHSIKETFSETKSKSPKKLSYLPPVRFEIENDLVNKVDKNHEYLI